MEILFQIPNTGGLEAMKRDKIICAVLNVMIICIAMSGCGGAQNAAAGNNVTKNTINSGGQGTGTSTVTETFSGSLSITCYDTGRQEHFLDDAAQQFMSVYPNVTVTVNAFSKPPDVKTGQDANGNPQAMITVNENQQAQDQADYVQSVNTELMSGKGADILVMDILPYQKYADGGQLADMDSLMDSDPAFNQSDYYMNVLDAAKYDGKLYLFPLDFTFDFFAYDSTLLDAQAQSQLDKGGPFTYDQLIGIGKASFEANKAKGDESMMFQLPDPQDVYLMKNLMAVDYVKCCRLRQVSGHDWEKG